MNVSIIEAVGAPTGAETVARLIHMTSTSNGAVHNQMTEKKEAT